jgi:membrane associated rhomboid family serine protease
MADLRGNRRSSGGAQAMAAAIHVVPDDNFDDWAVLGDIGQALGHYPTREAAGQAAQFALIPARSSEVASGEPDLDAADILPFFSMIFLHGGWLHLIFNMWTLWLFGPTIEDRLGHGRYLAFYLVCGLAASVALVMFNPTSDVPALGASGAIAGILGCYMRLFPLAQVVVVVPILLIPLFFEIYAFAFIGLWFLLQLLQSTMELLLPPPAEASRGGPMSAGS